VPILGIVSSALEPKILRRFAPFAVVLPGCSLDEARVVLERLRQRTPDGQTCSVGLA